MPAGFFVFRTPLLPFREFLIWGDGLEAPAKLDDNGQLEQALARDRALLRERLSTISKRPAVRDALFVASPNIIDRFHLWSEDPDSERGLKLEHVLVRYFSRMAGRATPFGLFAGVSVGSISNRTQLSITACEHYQRHTRLDMDYLFALTDALGRQSDLRKVFTYYSNSSIYRAAGRVRYVESRLEDKTRSYHLVAVEATDYLDAVLSRASSGARLTSLAEALVDDEISITDAEKYVVELIESQILVPEILLPVTGPEPVHTLVDQLLAYPATSEFARTLDRVRTAMAEFDKSGVGVEAGCYRSVTGLLESLPAKVELSRLFQVDMVKPAPEASIGGAVLDEIIRGVGVLHRLGPVQREDSLSRFREAFVARYEQREVPLVEALDEEIGIGFGSSGETSPLLKDLMFPSTPHEIGFEPARHTLLLRKLGEALQRSALEINFEQTELEAISPKDTLPFPDSFAVEATLAAGSQEALDRGDFRLFLQGGAGPSGANLLGRFCHADETLHKNVMSLLRTEEALRSDAVFAEIAHLPEGRIGNVIFRPVMRDCEIPYLGSSSVSRDKQFPVTDLYISVQGNRIRLRSARTGREVIPRMTNAHNYSWGSLGVYRFLCSLQHQGTSVCPVWDWGALWSAPFLPRVTSGRLVLALARWRLHKDELRVGGLKGAARFQAVQRLRGERQLPRLVALADADNVLPVDLDNALSVDSFVQLIKKREEATLQEIFPGPEQLCAHGPEGRFVHELIVPFVQTTDEAGLRGRGDTETGRHGDGETGRQGEGENESSFSASPRLRVTVSPDLPVTVSPDLPVAVSPHLPVSESPRSSFRRRFSSGSEWLYAKLYTGTATADHVLRDCVRDLTDDVLGSGAADQWFFIRYGDPDWHLRLRFHGSPEGLTRDVLPALQTSFNSLLDDGRLWRVQFDTYEREVERYGGPEGMVLAERIFHLDSEASLEIIEMLEPGDEGVDERWRLTLYGIDLLLADFGLDLRGKHAVIKQAREAFAREFKVDKSLATQLGMKFRNERRSLETLLASAPDHPLAPGLAVFQRRSLDLLPVVAELKACEQGGALEVSMAELLSSYVHMHANRLLRSAQRQQELVIYDLLTRLYQSQIARS